ncbi:penicillin-binding transpeptidase domain-containing protein [Marinoscillum pacificum]|uniref:penicillin-binding transpeptidase domain-containing protein n=1 Tax=Marinoscillum pacificum TaxID=392723 RepID=UPI0021579A56|nr:penicillin-binding transpeptidase domain-containing protein [Marinoscillum pacificum]
MNARSFIIQGLILFIALVFSIRLFSIQVIDDDYKLAAQNNILQKIVDYPFRGLIYDRDGDLLVYNTPVYDLMIVPKEVDLEDSTAIMELLEIDHATFEAKYDKARRYSSILSSKFVEQIPNEDFARIQDQLVKYSGFYPLPRTVRGYEKSILANTLGYIAEVSRSEINRDTTNYYKGGDYIGKVGIEKQYEDKLRGKRGVRYKIVNVQGVVKGEFKDGEYDTASVPGQSIQLTIDSELQAYAEKLLAGKVGSLVAIDPKTGDILAMVSAPSYDPNQLSGRNLSEFGPSIMNDSLKPLFNRPLQAMYPPGSMFKTIQALIAMQENKLSPTEKIICDGSLIGDHAPPGIYDVERAIQLSSNNYFYKVFKRVIEQGDHDSRYIDARIGMEKWNDYISRFGLGNRLGVDIPNEQSGYIPDIQFYDRVYGTNRWAFSNIYSLSIGQGEVLVTPIQMANLGALLANRGHYYTPHIVKSIDDQGVIEPKLNDVGIDEVHFNSVIDGMQKMAESNFRVPIQDIIVCGKTSTVENPHGMDHSGFMGFAPKENPQIAIAAYVENAGWGARAAAGTASLVIEKYITGEINRPWLEEFVLKGDFLDERQKRELEAMNKAKKLAAQ